MTSYLSRSPQFKYMIFQYILFSMIFPVEMHLTSGQHSPDWSIQISNPPTVHQVKVRFLRQKHAAINERISIPCFISVSSITSEVLFPRVSGRNQQKKAAMNDKPPINANGKMALTRVIWTTNGEQAPPTWLARDTIPMPLFLKGTNRRHLLNTKT